MKPYLLGDVPELGLVPSEPVMNVCWLRGWEGSLVRSTEGSSGLDLEAAENVMIIPGDVVRVKTALSMSLPRGYEAQVRSRSGLANQGIVCVNSPGTIDSDYRGEIVVLLHNLFSPTRQPFKIRPRMRIAQLIIARTENPIITEVSRLDATARGAGGLGSTGV